VASCADGGVDTTTTAIAIDGGIAICDRPCTSTGLAPPPLSSLGPPLLVPQPSCRAPPQMMYGPMPHEYPPVVHCSLFLP
jgi:hypothetical protein